MKFRLKFLIIGIGFLIFWFGLFYPFILPWMNHINMYPLLAVFLYELLFYLSTVVFTNIVLGEDRIGLSFRVGFVIFAIYHVLTAPEPPLILTKEGLWNLSESALISWDYGVSYTLHQIGISGAALYYSTYIGVIVLLVTIATFVVAPSLLSKLIRRIID